MFVFFLFNFVLFGWFFFIQDQYFRKNINKLKRKKAKTQKSVILNYSRIFKYTNLFLDLQFFYEFL